MNEDILARINQLERQILIHSYIYYEKDANIWTDHFYDDRCKELYKLLCEHPTEASFAEWSSAFNGYDPSTGFGLPYRNPWVVNKAEYLYDLYMRKKQAVETVVKPTKAQSTLFNINTKPKKQKPVEAKVKQNKLF